MQTSREICNIQLEHYLLYTSLPSNVVVCLTMVMELVLQKNEYWGYCWYLASRPFCLNELALVELLTAHVDPHNQSDPLLERKKMRKSLVLFPSMNVPSNRLVVP
jgi:hypothetical protein